MFSPLLLPQAHLTQSSPGLMGGAGCREGSCKVTQSKDLNWVFSSHHHSDGTNLEKWELLRHQLLF